MAMSVTCPENPGKGKLGVDVEHDFAPEYVVNEDRRKQLNAITKAAASSDMVYLATDLDREGEAIAWHVVEAVEIPDEKTQRVTFSEITKSAISEAFASAARHRHGTRGRPADAPHHGPHRGLHAQPAHQPQGAQWPLGRPRAVGRGTAGGRARARRSRPSRRASTGPWRPCSRRPPASATRPRW